MGRFGNDGIDTVVLGCTHYPLIADTLQDLLGPQVTLVDSGAPVARQTRRVLPEPAVTGHPLPHLSTTGHPEPLRAAVDRWLQPQFAIETLRG